MGTHGLLDLCHDDGACCFNPQKFPGLYDVIGVSLDPLNPAGAQDLLQICSFHKQLIPASPEDAGSPAVLMYFG